MMTDATPDSTSNPAAQMRKLVNAYQLSQPPDPLHDDERPPVGSPQGLVASHQLPAS